MCVCGPNSRGWKREYVVSMREILLSYNSFKCTNTPRTHAQRLAWRHSANAAQAVLWKQRAVCFAGSEQGQKIWALTLINLSVVNPEHPVDSCQRTSESSAKTGGTQQRWTGKSNTIRGLSQTEQIICSNSCYVCCFFVSHVKCMHPSTSHIQLFSTVFFIY